ncbi:MBL fold metallo-hydrolase [Haloferula sp.]|uniref:MBL fold metallo-hydrolase n=1 Tax=Haloferula sp. TaxID=2497595 RepID=UPI00329F0AC8
MPSDFEITFLGTGTSVGVPVIGCDCPVCTSDDPRNTRTRSSIHVRAGDVSLLVDSGPDLREQALREGITKVDAVLYTHGHVDHVAGFDELRAFCWHRDTPLPMHGNADTIDILRTMYGWAFSEKNVYRGYVKPATHLFDGPISYGETKITPLLVEHGAVETHGFLFEHAGSPPTAYIPDVKKISQETLDRIHQVDVLIIDSLRPATHPTHMSVTEALATIEHIDPGKALLTHLGHENDHATLESTLPPTIRVAYDGLKL